MFYRMTGQDGKNLPLTYMFHHPTLAVSSYSSSQLAARTVRNKSIGGFYCPDLSPCVESIIFGNHAFTEISANYSGDVISDSSKHLPHSLLFDGTDFPVESALN